MSNSSNKRQLEKDYNRLKISSNCSIIEEKDELIVEIDRSKESGVYLFLSIFFLLIFLALIIGFILNSINPFEIEFTVLPISILLFFLLFYLSTYWFIKYLNYNYFHRVVQFFFDKSLQKIIYNKIVPRNKKPKTYDLSKVESLTLSVIYLKDKVDIYHDIHRVMLYLNGFKLIQIYRSNLGYECRNLGKIISEFLNCPFVTKESQRFAIFLGNSILIFSILFFIEIPFRFPYPEIFAFCFITNIIFVALGIIFNMTYFLKKKNIE